MITIIINNDASHAIEANEMNYSTTMGIDNYSSHTETISLNIDISSLGNVQTFENVRIQSLSILNEQEENIVTLTFTEDLYITSFNSNIYNNGSSAYVNISKINKQTSAE